MKFREWLENYKEVDPEKEAEKVQDINMTAHLPLSDKAPLDQIRGLTRGFHLNTIIGRMMQRWVNGLRFAPVDYKLAQTDPEKATRYRVSGEDKRGNDNYKAAYEMFKQEIANAVAALPFKTGINVLSGKPEDVLMKSKDFLSGYRSEDKDLIRSLNDAWKIYVSVFGNDPSRNYSQILNFMNFLQIVKEEFMTIGEMLPKLGDDDGMRQVDSRIVKELDKEINKYDQMLRG